MNKKLVTLLVMLLSASCLFSAPVDESVARKAGGSFAQTAFTTPSRTDALQLVMTDASFFVYNVGSTGFVIVSSDDSFRPIVGYSDEGTFDTQNPSPEMMYYLNSISRGRQEALRNAIAPDPLVAQEWTALLAGEKLPSRNGTKGSFYLVKTKWNQNDPYNKLCPTGNGGGRSYAGCVATAMSQVMNYWKYPAHGYGSHSYTHYNYGVLSADFSQAEYHYELMPVSIDAFSPAESIQAVAEFMYHCGIAVDMSYSPSGSGAYSQDVPGAVLRYFGYTNACRYYLRDNYSLAEFQALLKDQFDMGWPCYYSGQDTDGSGGHAFVCDGYDDKDMFHFNWGWSASGDGFYVIDELNVSSYAFNDDQGIVANFVPAEVFQNTAKAPDMFQAEPNGDENFSVTLSWINPSATLDGHPLDSIEQIVITRDGQVVHTIDQPVPGMAMTYVDPAGLPILVNYAVYAVCHGYGGRRANVRGVNLGPTCEWTIRLTSTAAAGWRDGSLEFQNSAGVSLGKFMAERSESQYALMVPQGGITMRWTAPTTPIDLGIEILDTEGQPVFTFEGSSSLMPEGIFYETVNTCGGEVCLGNPSQLTASVEGEDVLLQWTGLHRPGYGYNIYRDGYLYTMVANTTDFTDRGAALEPHDYKVTYFCYSGETDPSNTCCAVAETEGMMPRNFSGELLQNGRIKLTWDLPEVLDSIAGFMIYRKMQGEAYTPIKIVGPTTTQYKDNTSHKPGERYYYQLTALYNHGDVESSPAPNAVNPDLLYCEVNWTHIPEHLTLSEENGQIVLQWDPALAAETYNVYGNGQLLREGLVETTCTLDMTESLAEGVFTVTGVLNGVESSPSNRAYSGSASVEESDPTEVKLFPNPTQGQVRVEADGLCEVVIANALGQQLGTVPAEARTLDVDLAGQPSGVYFLKIVTEKGQQVRKVVLVKQ